MNKIYNSPYYSNIVIVIWLILWWVSMMAGAGLIVYQFYLQWEMIEWGGVIIILFIGVIGFVYVLMKFAIRQFIVSEQVIIQDDIVIAHGWLQKEKKFNINDIVVIHRTFIDNVVRLEDNEKNILMRVGVSLSEFGELMEHLLENATNIQTINFDPDTLTEKRWHKAVNMELMNRAKIRAEENRKKKETT